MPMVSTLAYDPTCTTLASGGMGSHGSGLVCDIWPGALGPAPPAPVTSLTFERANGLGSWREVVFATDLGGTILIYGCLEAVRSPPTVECPRG